MNRFLIAMVCFAALGVAAWRTLEDSTLRIVTLAVLGSFAARTWLAQRAEARKQSDSEQVEPM